MKESDGDGGREKSLEKNPSLNKKKGGGRLNHLETNTIGRRVIDLLRVVTGRQREGRQEFAELLFHVEHPVPT